MKVFTRKIVMLIAITSVIAAPRYPRYKRSDDSSLSNLQSEPKSDDQSINSNGQSSIPQGKSTLSNDQVKVNGKSINKDTETSTSKSQTTTSFDQTTSSTSRLTAPFDQTTVSKSDSKKLKKNVVKESVSKNIETMPSGLEIYGVENRFSCFLRVANGKRICKPLNFFIILNKNNYDCQDRNIEIAFRGYDIELEETDEFIEGFLNHEQGEIDGNQIRERDCFFYKK
jgi:hypothetical protein